MLADEPNNPAAMGMPYMGGFDDKVTEEQEPHFSIVDTLVGKRRKEFMADAVEGISQRFDPVTNLPYDPTVGMLPDPLGFSIFADLAKGAGNMLGAAAAAPGNWLEAARRKVPTFLDPSGMTGILTGAKEVADVARAGLNAIPSMESPLVQGAGQLWALAATGGVAAAGGVGAAAGGTFQYEDALQNDANANQGVLALLGGTAIGSTDMIPLALAWKRIDKALGGKLQDFVTGNNYFADMPDWVKREAILGFAVEGGQELGQTAGENWVAKELAGYDPTRSLNENVAEAVLTGGLIGGTTGYLIGKARAQEKQALMDAYVARVKELVNTNPINALEAGAQFTPLQDYVFLNKERLEIQEALSQKGQELRERYNTEILGRDVDPGFSVVSKAAAVGAHPISLTTPTGAQNLIAPAKQVPRLDSLDYNAEPKFQDFLNNTPTEPRVHPKNVAKGGEDAGNSYSILEALKTEDVVVSYVNPYAEQYKTVERGRQAAEQLLQEALTTPGVSPSTIKMAKMRLSQAKKWKIDLDKKTRIAERVMKDVREYTKAFRQVFGPEYKFVITDGTYVDEAGLFPDRKTQSGAIYIPLHNIPLDENTTTSAVVMYLDLDDIVTKVFTDETLRRDMIQEAKRQGTPKEALKAMRRTARKASWYNNQAGRNLFTTLNHEIGHRLLTGHLNQLIAKAKAGDVDAANTFFTLFGEYEQWIKTAAKSPIKFFLETVASAHHLNKTSSIVQAVGRGQEGLAGSAGYADPAQAAQYLRYLYSFDEFAAERTAKIVTSLDGGLQELLPETKFHKEVAESFKKFFDQLPDQYKKVYDSDWKNFLRAQGISARLEELQGEAPVTLLDLLKGNKSALGFSPDQWAGFQAALDKWSWIQDLGQTLLQNAKDNPHVAPLQAYVAATTQWAAFTRNMTAETNKIIERLNSIGKGSASKISEVLFEEARNKARYTTEELSKRLDETEAGVYLAIRGELDKVLQMMKTIVIKDAQQTLAENPEALAARLEEINAEFNKMQQSAYFPFMRFGRYSIFAKAKEDMEFEGERVKKGQTLTFQTFESEKERDLALTQLQKDLGDRAALSKGVLSDTEFAIQGMPRSMLLSLKNSMKGEDATPEQIALIDRMLEATTPFQSFRKQWIKKKGIHGYSEDMIRSFASYMRMAAGHMARVQYSPQLFGQIQQMDAEMQVMRQTGEPTQRRQMMRDWMARHFSYIMNPTNEWTALRGAISVAYLGLNVKSAALQIVQIPQVVYPYLAVRYGDAESVAALTKAPWVMRDYVMNPLEFTPKPIEDPEFAKLFKGSKVTDSRGKPLQLYHGTTADFENFSESRIRATNWYGKGFYFTDDPELASAVGVGNDDPISYRTGANVRPVYLNLKNPATDKTLLLPEVAEALEMAEIVPEGLQQVLQKLGHDGLIVTNKFGRKEYIAFKPEQIISSLQFPQKVAPTLNQLPEKERLGMMITQGMNDQWLDQSFATELALAASENTLDRGLAVGSYLQSKAKRMWHKSTKFMMLPFHITEKANRFTTAIAAYRLEFERSGDHVRAVYAAREANWSANFEYARWNRPEFSRGKKSVALMFSSFWQNSLYFATKDPGATRYWLMMLMLAGLMGLPFAEDIEDLLSGVLTWGKEKLGYKDPYTDLQMDAREFLKEMGSPSFVADYILHGISQDSFGAGLMEELLGLPIPRIDTSASVGMGNVIPGTELLQQQLAARGRPQAGASLVAGAVEAAGGAAASMGLDLVNAAVSGNVASMKDAEKLIPFMFARNASKAYRMMTEGQEASRAGEPIAQFDPDEPRDIAEIVLQGLGFTPRKVSQGWQEYMASKTLIAYYESRRRILQAQLNKSFLQDDRESRADALKAIADFNKNVPYPEFAITDPGQGVEQFLQRQAEAGILGINDKRYARIRRQVGEVFGSGRASASTPGTAGTDPP